MPRYVLCLVVGLFLGSLAFGQTAIVSATPADIQLSSGTILFLPDGGCDAQATFTDPTNRQSAVHHTSSALCSTARDRFMRAATLDVGVSDGGAP